MSEQNAAVAVYGTHTGAEEAVKQLQHAGVDMHTLSSNRKHVPCLPERELRATVRLAVVKKGKTL